MEGEWPIATEQPYPATMAPAWSASIAPSLPVITGMLPSTKES